MLSFKEYLLEGAFPRSASSSWAGRTSVATGYHGSVGPSQSDTETHTQRWDRIDQDRTREKLLQRQRIRDIEREQKSIESNKKAQQTRNDNLREIQKTIKNGESAKGLLANYESLKIAHKESLDKKHHTKAEFKKAFDSFYGEGAYDAYYPYTDKYLFDPYKGTAQFTKLKKTGKFDVSLHKYKDAYWKAYNSHLTINQNYIIAKQLLTLNRIPLPK